MAKQINCPLCGYLLVARRHHRRSHIVSAEIQLLEHLRQYHAEEIEKRLRALGTAAVDQSGDT